MVDLPVSLLVTRPDARKIDPGVIKFLVQSIPEVGFISPLRVRPVKLHIDGAPDADAYEVTAGGHRLLAARTLGYETVPCIIVEDDDLHAELAMLDENLCRADLDPAQRAKQTARRKVIYLELNPETGRGGDRKSSKFQDESLNSKPTFAADMAVKTGKSQPTIWRDTDRGEKIAPDILDKISGTKLSTGGYLDQLKKIADPDKQLAKVKRDLVKPTKPKPSTADLIKKERAALDKAWRLACPEAREGFLAGIGAVIHPAPEAVAA